MAGNGKGLGKTVGKGLAGMLAELGKAIADGKERSIEGLTEQAMKDGVITADEQSEIDNLEAFVDAVDKSVSQLASDFTAEPSHKNHQDLIDEIQESYPSVSDED